MDGCGGVDGFSAGEGFREVVPQDERLRLAASGFVGEQCEELLAVCRACFDGLFQRFFGKLVVAFSLGAQANGAAQKVDVSRCFHGCFLLDAFQRFGCSAAVLLVVRGGGCFVSVEIFGAADWAAVVVAQRTPDWRLGGRAGSAWAGELLNLPGADFFGEIDKPVGVCAAGGRFAGKLRMRAVGGDGLPEAVMLAGWRAWIAHFQSARRQ